VRWLTFHFCAALLLFGGVHQTVAQDAVNGKWLAERWCSQCHDIGSTRHNLNKAPSFASIASKQPIDAKKLASLVSHAPMPGPPLTPRNIEQIADYINQLKNGHN
jgi:mono/diheme cytochrome c family protein